MKNTASNQLILFILLVIPLLGCINENNKNKEVRYALEDTTTSTSITVVPLADTVIYDIDSSIYISTSAFKTDQLKKVRVKTSYQDKGQIIMSYLKKNNISLDSLEIFIRIFKEDEILEVWGKNRNDDEFKSLIAYRFSANSGILGPKRQEGDNQIPEGFYYINVFNPYSAFYLSIGIDYPNKSDRILGERNSLGGDIFLHGSNATIGCVPITDDKIKELYILAVEAKSHGQAKIPVHIFPTYLDEKGLTGLLDVYYGEKYLKFWRNIQLGYLYFEYTKRLPKISVSQNGKYLFQ